MKDSEIKKTDISEATRILYNFDLKKGSKNESSNK